jgi:hypothetical protein
MKRLLYLLTFIGSLTGAFFLLLVFLAAESAPQEAALAATAVAFAVIPYCLARAVEGFDRDARGGDLRVIADHYRKQDYAAEQQRLAELRRGG